MTRDAALAHLETYLTQVRRRLRGLSEAEIGEVLDELRAHVLDRVEGQLTPGTVEAALAALGPPGEVARLNATERVAARMEADRSLLGVARAVGRMATLSVLGFVTLLVSVFGYSLSAGLLFAAAWKVVDPQRVGVWRTPDPDDPLNYVIGVTDPSPAAVEVLGWWLVPVGAVLGVAVGYLTWRVGVASVRMMGRRRARDRA